MNPDSPLPQYRGSRAEQAYYRDGGNVYVAKKTSPLHPDLRPGSDGPLPLSDAEQHPYDDEELEGAREAIEEFGDPWYPSARLLATIDRLRADLTAAQEERDAAIAHDRQPYPTAWAYEQVCKARDGLAERLEKAEAVERAAADIFRAITGGWGALQAIGPTHEQLAAYVTASNLAAPKEEQGTNAR